MTTTLDMNDPQTLSLSVRLERARQASIHEVFALKPLPCSYCGRQEGFGSVPAFDLYNILEGIDGHPAGSTVSINTLTRKGYVPALYSV